MAGTPVPATIYERREGRMNSVQCWLFALAVPLVAFIVSPDDANAQKRDLRSLQPVVHSFVLRHAGHITLDPFASSGRREVLQLMEGRDPLRGSFRRARLHDIGDGEWVEEGWYEIKGDLIHLFHYDRNGSLTGRVEVGRYLEKVICLQDPENGEPLAFAFLAPSRPPTRIAETGKADKTEEMTTTDVEEDDDVGQGSGLEPSLDPSESINSCDPTKARTA